VWPERLGKFKNSPNQVSNPRPSGLLHSALATTLPCAPSVAAIDYIDMYVGVVYLNFL
jgi:hypothetical protein